MNPLGFALGALTLVGVAVFNVIEPKPSVTFMGTFVTFTLLLVAGLLMGGLAVLLFPPVFGRVLAREKRRHPERFNRH
jgi:H+/gluconate symporter-like permease